MKPDFSQIYHQLSKDFTKGHSPMARDRREEWPESWKTIYYKAYPRFPIVELASGSMDHALFSAIASRKSRRDFTGAPISNGQLSCVLQYSCGLVGNEQPGGYHRAYPSAGGRFGVEVYCIVANSSHEGIRKGIYHYNVRKHALEQLKDLEGSPANYADRFFSDPVITHVSVLILMVGVFARIRDKYGELAYRFCLLEAGHMGQNVYLVSAALGLKCCALGGLNYETIERELNIDGVNESVVYGIALGG